MSSDIAGEMFDVTGRTCVITGGGGVLGGHIARTLAGAGAAVAVLGRHKENTGLVAEDIRQSGGHALAAVCDVLDEKSVQEACGKVRKEFGDVHVLINGAGGAVPEASTDTEFFQPDGKGGRDIFSLDIDAFRKTADLNFLGSVIPIRVFSRGMVENGSGCIINISSMGAEWPLTKSPAYSAGKAAVANFTKWLAVYFADVNVRVNAVSPGFFLTKQNRFLLVDEKTGKPTPRGDRIIKKTPQGRFGKPGDLDSTVLWLISERSSFITGAVIPVDGGFSAYGGV